MIGQFHTLAALQKKKKRKKERNLVLIGQKAGWVPECIWTLQLQKESLAPAKNQSPVVQH
jgi:hypothetical protein